jgi:hypothetical protein
MEIISIPEYGDKDVFPSNGPNGGDFILLLEDGSRTSLRKVVFMQQKSDDGNCAEYFLIYLARIIQTHIS